MDGRRAADKPSVGNQFFCLWKCLHLSSGTATKLEMNISEVPVESLDVGTASAKALMMKYNVIFSPLAPLVR